jgi:hypothetical protein
MAACGSVIVFGLSRRGRARIGIEAAIFDPRPAPVQPDEGPASLRRSGFASCAAGGPAPKLFPKREHIRRRMVDRLHKPNPIV